MFPQLETDTAFEALEPSLRWIHEDLTELELQPLLCDAQVRLAGCAPQMQSVLHPLVKSHRGQRLAASYFKILSGDVATLGGVRAAPGCEPAAQALLGWQIDALRHGKLPQIQAVVRAGDGATAELVAQAGLKHLTGIEHQWLDVSQQAVVPGPVAKPRHLSWRPAQHFAHARLAHFIEATFAETLDCPAINGRRDRGQVLEGFLDGRRLRQTAPLWQVLEVDRRVAGCLLLQQHAPELVELVYMGLLPSARGRGLGRSMVQQAIDITQQLGCQTLVVAVDQQNWPALEVYRSFGFKTHQRLQVWIVD